MTAPASVNGAEQKPIEGVSIAYTFDDPAAATAADHPVFRDVLGNRGIYTTARWMAMHDAADCTVGRQTAQTWTRSPDTGGSFITSPKISARPKNLAASAADVLKDMQIRFYAEAAKYNVLPIDNSRTGRMDPAIRPSLTRGRTSFTFYEGMTRIPEGASPDIKNRSFSITGLVDVPDAKASGMIITQGGFFGGYGLYLEKGKPIFHYNFVDVAHYRIAGNDASTRGKAQLEGRLHRSTAEGWGRVGSVVLSVDGNADGRRARSGTRYPVEIGLDESLDIGEDTGTPLDQSYERAVPVSGKDREGDDRL